MKDVKKDSQGIEALTDLGKAIIVSDKPISEEDKKVLVENKPASVVVLNKEQRKKLAADSKQVNKVLGIKKKKGKSAKEANLPAHIRKAYITINDKTPNDPISVTFNGDWTGKDINLAGKHLILEYQVFVRNRAISDK